VEIEAIQELFEYSFWAFDLIWPRIEQLNNDQFSQDIGYSLGSIRNEVIHLISSHRRWLHRLQDQEVPKHLEFSAFPTINSARKEWDQGKKEILDYVNSLNHVSLNELVPYQIPSRSVDAADSRWRILMHLINHSTDHRAQILAVLNMHFGIDTPEQDFILYLWQKGSRG
jgi:uncharacterized damage-inducible protein DinB